MSDSSTTLSGEWWESISAYENNYVPDSFTPSSSVEANHDLLSGLRDNDFDITNQDYSEFNHLVWPSFDCVVV